MTRRFRADAAVPESVVADLLELAGRAPSAGFSQGWEYVVLRSPAERETFWATAGPDQPDSRTGWLAGVRRAPVLVLVLADEDAYRRRYAAADKGGIPPAEQDWPVPYWLTDTAMGALIVLLGATEAGLGSLFFGVPGPRHAAVKDAFGVPAGLDLIGVIALGEEEGRVGGSASTRPRRPVSDYVHWGGFGVAPAGPEAGLSENAGQTGSAAESRPARRRDPASGASPREESERTYGARERTAEGSERPR